MVKKYMKWIEIGELLVRMYFCSFYMFFVFFGKYVENVKNGWWQGLLGTESHYLFEFVFYRVID